MMSRVESCLSWPRSTAVLRIPPTPSGSRYLPRFEQSAAVAIGQPTIGSLPTLLTDSICSRVFPVRFSDVGETKVEARIANRLRARLLT